MPFHQMFPIGASWFCKVAGAGPISPDTAPVSKEEEGGHRAAGPAQGVPGSKRLETQKGRCNPSAGSHQKHAGKESLEKEKKRR